ncbi:lipase ROG1 family protein [Aspergillus foveolatus]|uniref:lipase ROG1 family protein n=1 Tax=Aspergillus foveolatus TaxID=210207 RepID=UPI003CCD8D07
MFITPRTYSASQTLDRNSTPTGVSNRLRFSSLTGWHTDPTDVDRAIEMPLIRQAGSVRVGEVIRYTLKYRPAADEIQPPPAALHVKVRNTSAIPLRAAYLHGPYTLYVSCYPYTFDPNVASCPVDTLGTPQFEPYLKAGGTWIAVIPIPKCSEQQDPGSRNCPSGQDTTWIIEIISQVVFSSTASVNFEVIVGRNEASLDFLPSIAQSSALTPADLRDHWPSGSDGKQVLATKGVYSKSVTLLIDDTASLWNTPQLSVSNRHQSSGNNDDFLTNDSPPKFTSPASGAHQSEATARHSKPRRNIHLVVLTHGLHSNLGADMLYLKESIDAAVKKNKPSGKSRAPTNESTLKSPFLPESGSVTDDHDCQNEDVIVRGFPGNAARTERGIQYLGKRLAKYILLMTYPDQPYLPRKKSKAKTFSGPVSPCRTSELSDGEPECLSFHEVESHIEGHYTYQITSISFIGHSLGGLVQTYAIAYIQKHSPGFFDNIKPINFIALATPFLGLSNENPVYVRFALDFGLVGRTGQDLGLSWTTPKGRSGWEAIIGGKAQPPKSEGNADTRAKPLLRILPSGPAHDALAKFKRRTIYSNLVNDGIVPLRTSCLLFLDWKGLQRVEKARRDNGIVGTMAEWGWAELTGANSKSPRISSGQHATGNSEKAARTAGETSSPVLSRGVISTQSSSLSILSSAGKEPAIQEKPLLANDFMNTDVDGASTQSPSSALTGLFSLFRPQEHGRRQAKILRRSQTIAPSISQDLIQEDGPYFDHDSHDTGFTAPPRTTVFESAGDILMPPLPPVDYIVNPESRPRTILHDRVYHPKDIPPPIVNRRRVAAGTSQVRDTAADHAIAEDFANNAGLKVEEKIARAYHRGLSWRKVLVRLEPDAHNNIIVRRMFTNAYGWPVVQHLVDAHFGPSSSDPEYLCEDSPGGPAPPVGIAENVCQNI